MQLVAFVPGCSLGLMPMAQGQGKESQHLRMSLAIAQSNINSPHALFWVHIFSLCLPILVFL